MRIRFPLTLNCLFLTSPILTSCAGGAPCIADALRLESLGRYNDGSPARQVTLAPMDGIVLRRMEQRTAYLPLAESR